MRFQPSRHSYLEVILTSFEGRKIDSQLTCLPFPKPRISSCPLQIRYNISIHTSWVQIATLHKLPVTKQRPPTSDIKSSEIARDPSRSYALTFYPVKRWDKIKKIKNLIQFRRVEVSDATRLRSVESRGSLVTVWMDSSSFTPLTSFSFSCLFLLSSSLFLTGDPLGNFRISGKNLPGTSELRRVGAFHRSLLICPGGCKSGGVRYAVWRDARRCISEVWAFSTLYFIRNTIQKLTSFTLSSCDLTFDSRLNDHWFTMQSFKTLTFQRLACTSYRRNVNDYV